MNTNFLKKFIPRENKKDDKSVKDIFVSSKHLMGAIHEDKVEINLLSSSYGRKRDRLEGKVVAIIEQKHTQIVGRITFQGEVMLCLPDHRRLYPLRIPKRFYKDAKENDKVVVEIMGLRDPKRKLTGKVIKVLGSSGSYKAETEALFFHFGLKPSFSSAIQKGVASLPEHLSKEEIKKRRDFRDVLTFTIDPENALDFDDAISIRLLENGNFEIGVHIADVTHYVEEKGPIDQEALERGSSVYLVDQVVPMLPERLSNDLCSLKPQEVRPAFAVVVEMDKEAKIKKEWIGETVIFSDKRFTYEEAMACIEGQSGPHYAMLTHLHKLTQRMRQRRIQRGAIAFETTDVKISLNANKEPINIAPKPPIFTQQLIEELMLMANESIAKSMAKHSKKGGIYRSHGNPKAEKLALFSSFARQLGYPFTYDKENPAQAFNGLLKKVKGTPAEQVIQALMIRSMEQALYTTKPDGHFGLQSAFYTHFTSPIRRYPDLIVHRIMKAILANKALPSLAYSKIANNSSARERLAIEAERSSIDFFQVTFMKSREGMEYKGVISGVTQWGIYVEIVENKCEGMIRLADLLDDYYIFVPEKFCLEGKRTKKVYRFGDTIFVQVKSCNLEQKTIDLVPVTP